MKKDTNRKGADMRSVIELTDLSLALTVGTYGPDDVVPRDHLLDLTLTIDPSLVFIPEDGMEQVFDYDPLVREIDALSQEVAYDTQERLMTRIAEACAGHAAIEAVEIAVKKRPVLRESGVLGLRLFLDAGDMARLRAGAAT